MNHENRVNAATAIVDVMIKSQGKTIDNYTNTEVASMFVLAYEKLKEIEARLQK